MTVGGFGLTYYLGNLDPNPIPNTATTIFGSTPGREEEGANISCHLV